MDADFAADLDTRPSHTGYVTAGPRTLRAHAEAVGRWRRRVPVSKEIAMLPAQQRTIVLCVRTRRSYAACAPALRISCLHGYHNAAHDS